MWEWKGWQAERGQKREEIWKWKISGKGKKKRGLSNRRGEQWKSEKDFSKSLLLSRVTFFFPSISLA